MCHGVTGARPCGRSDSVSWERRHSSTFLSSLALLMFCRRLWAYLHGVAPVRLDERQTLTVSMPMPHRGCRSRFAGLSTMLGLPSATARYPSLVRAALAAFLSATRKFGREVFQLGFTPTAALTNRRRSAMTSCTTCWSSPQCQQREREERDVPSERKVNASSDACMSARNVHDECWAMSGRESSDFRVTYVCSACM